MEIIDAHTHIRDIFLGHPIASPIREIPFGLVTIREWMGFWRPPGTSTESGRLMGDIAFLESCRRIQLCEPDAYYEHMDRNKISSSVILPIAPMVSTEEVLEIAEKYKRFRVFASPDFRSPNPAEKIHQFMCAGCVGLKIHPVLQFVRPDAKPVEEILSDFAQYGKPVCIHAGPCRAGIAKTYSEEYSSAEHVAPMVRKYPKIPFIVAHMGHEYYSAFFDLARECENVYFDTSFQPVAVLRKALEVVGEDRILFGSDFPLVSQASVLRVVQKAYGHNPRVLEKVLAKNVKALCGI